MAAPAVTQASNVPNLSGQNTSGTAVSGAVTVNTQMGVVTSESLATAPGADYVLTLTNSSIYANSVVLFSVGNGSNTTIPVYPHSIQPANGSVVAKFRNAGGGALNGTLLLGFVVL